LGLLRLRGLGGLSGGLTGGSSTLSSGGSSFSGGGSSLSGLSGDGGNDSLFDGILHGSPVSATSTSTLVLTGDRSASARVTVEFTSTHLATLVGTRLVLVTRALSNVLTGFTRKASLGDRWGGEGRSITLRSVALLGATNDRLRRGLGRSGSSGSSGLRNHDWLICESIEHVGAHFLAFWRCL